MIQTRFTLYSFIVSTSSCLIALIFYLLIEIDWQQSKKTVISNIPTQNKVSITQNKKSIPISSAEIAFQNWLKKGKKAEDINNFDEAARCYSWALSYKSNTELANHLQQLNKKIIFKHKKLLALSDKFKYAQKLENQYKYQEAIVLYQQLKKSLTEKRQVSDRLKSCQQSLKIQKIQYRFLNQAQHLESQGNFRQAKNLYKKIIAKGNTVDLRRIRTKIDKISQRIVKRKTVHQEITIWLGERRYAKAFNYLQQKDIRQLRLYKLTQKVETLFFKKMVTIPAGEVFIVAEDETDNFFADLPVFYIDRHEVTNYEYAIFIKATNKNFPNHWKNDELPIGKERHPVTGISWIEATEYAKWAGKRLPTEIEWEKAARGPDEKNYPWGDSFITEYCNTLESELKETTTIGSFPQGKSQYGCFDMIGNALEWTKDDSPSKRDYKIAKGGSWYYRGKSLKCSTKYPYHKSTKLFSLGFRCALDINQP